jgi:hypothetical protein
MGDADRLNLFLQSELDELIDEYREAEESDPKALNEFFQNVLKELPRNERVYNFIVALTYRRECSLVVAAASVYTFGLTYPLEDYVLPAGTKN